jgi:transcriptional regulator with GAF, ATPase, and Fis domain
MDDLTFFKTLTLNISSSLEPMKAWSKTFKFLTSHFPIEGISFHKLTPQKNAMHLQFLVLKDHYLELDLLLPLSEEELSMAAKMDHKRIIYHSPRATERPLGKKLLNALSTHFQEIDRAFLAIILRTESGEEIGHLCLIGKTVECFTPEHEHKFNLMQAPVSLALMNMQNYSQVQELKKRLDAERLQLAGEVKLLKDTSIVGASSGLHNTMREVEQLTGKEIPALILGETGTGKEVIADAIQKISPRTNKPFIKVNCGAIPDNLIDSELFGHEKGAFTGATAIKTGRFEQADGGTLFLDEVGELPLKAQVRLLRVLQNGTMERVGGEKSIKVDVRIIAATNRPLESMLQQGTFREDLYYRLNVFPVHLPPLRDRCEDISLLIRYFISELSHKMKLSDEVQLDFKCLDDLQAYSWPGNVRELRNLVERALTISPKGPLNIGNYLPKESRTELNTKGDDLQQMIREEVHKILAEVLPGNLHQTTPIESGYATENKTKTLDMVMADHIRLVVAQCNNKINGPGGAAERLDIHPNTLRKRMEKLNISCKHK